MPETYKGFRIEASAIAVAPGEFRGTALIFKAITSFGGSPMRHRFRQKRKLAPRQKLLRPTSSIVSSKVANWRSRRLIQ
jgi:hypothetical protein